MTKRLRRPVTLCAALGCLAFLACAFVAHSPARAVQRMNYSDLSSADLLQTDEVQYSRQDVQVIGDRLIVRLREDAPQGGYYEWQVVYRAVMTFEQDAQGLRTHVAAIEDYEVDASTGKVVPKRPVNPDWRESLPSRQRWEAHRAKARAGTLSDDERERLRALPEME